MNGRAYDDWCIQNSSFNIPHSTFIIQHSSFLIQNSTFLIRHSLFTIHYSLTNMHTASSPSLIIFVRQPQLGKVKTRLAATMGEAKALKVYELLLAHTYQVAAAMDMPVYVYYADGIAENDLWQGPQFYKKQQQGDDLGLRMSNAFTETFAQGHQQVIIVGSDCYDLTATILSDAFIALAQSDAVIGPATDGGYYLLGLNQPLPQLFEGIAWSTDTVAAATMGKLYERGYSVTMLQALTDVDEEKDVPADIQNQL